MPILKGTKRLIPTHSLPGADDKKEEGVIFIFLLFYRKGLPLYLTVFLVCECRKIAGTFLDYLFAIAIRFETVTRERLTSFCLRNIAGTNLTR